MCTAVDSKTKTLDIITQTIITTASRSGAVANTTEDEFLHSRKKDDQMIISVKRPQEAADSLGDMCACSGKTTMLLQRATEFVISCVWCSH